MLNQPLPEVAGRDLKVKLRITCIALVFLLLSGILFIIFRTGFNALGAALLWAFAAMVIGAIGGFLFAIPRAGQKSKLPDTPAGGTPVAVADDRDTGLGINTNLQDVSDWLTKMIVGIGLVELRATPGRIVRLGRYVGAAMGPGMESTAASIVLYFLGLGFLSSYLLTRMFISPAFMLADRATKDGVAYDAAKAAIAIAASSDTKSQTALDVVQVTGDITGAMEELAKSGPHSPARIDQLIALLGSYREQFPLNRRLHIVLARLHADGKGDFASAIQVLADFIAKKEKAGQRDNDTADAWFNIACYDSLQMKDRADPSSRAALEKHGVEAMRASIAIAPENLMDFPKDPDLKWLRESDSGKKLLQDAPVAVVSTATTPVASTSAPTAQPVSQEGPQDASKSKI